MLTDLTKPDKWDVLNAYTNVLYTGKSGTQAALRINNPWVAFVIVDISAMRIQRTGAMLNAF